jgi:hypothetical protein
MRNFSTTSHDVTRPTWLNPLIIVAVLVAALLVLGACDRLDLEKMDRVMIGMVERNGLNNMQARFELLTGQKTRREKLDEGNTLALAYEADVEQGMLRLQVKDPAGELVWEKELAAGSSVDDEVSLVAAQDGTYTITVRGDRAGGNYALTWDEVK